MQPATGVAQVPQPSCHVIVGLCFALVQQRRQASASGLEDFIRRNEQQVIPSQIRVRATKQILQYIDIYCSYFQFLFRGWFLWLVGLSSMFPDDTYLCIRHKKRPAACTLLYSRSLMESLSVHSQHNDPMSTCIKEKFWEALIMTTILRMLKIYI